MAPGIWNGQNMISSICRGQCGKLATLDWRLLAGTGSRLLSVGCSRIDGCCVMHGVGGRTTLFAGPRKTMIFHNISESFSAGSQKNLVRICIQCLAYLLYIFVVYLINHQF